MNDQAEGRKSIKVPPAAFDALDQLVVEMGMKQWVVVERLLMWVKSQPDSVRRQFVIPDGDPAAELLRLKELEQDDREDLTLEQALEAARRANGKVAQVARSIAAAAPAVAEVMRRKGK